MIGLIYKPRSIGLTTLMNGSNLKFITKLQALAILSKLKDLILDCQLILIVEKENEGIDFYTYKFTDDLFLSLCYY